MEYLQKVSIGDMITSGKEDYITVNFYGGKKKMAENMIVGADKIAQKMGVELPTMMEMIFAKGFPAKRNKDSVWQVSEKDFAAYQADPRSFVRSGDEEESKDKSVKVLAKKKPRAKASVDMKG